jgi:hypothetical protein
MRILTSVALLLCISFVASAQHALKPTSSFTITGEVKAPATIAIADLRKWKEAEIGDVVITNHLGDKKSDASALKGVLLRDILQSSVDITATSPKLLSEYYFVCKANDGYIVVYSWNEIFNTATGDSAYIITEKEGKPAASLSDAIQMMSVKDFKTGRRSLNALATIEVKRAQ